MSRSTDQQREASLDEEVSLVLRVAKQDWRAFEALYRIYFRRLARFIDKMTRQPHLIDEVIDDTMLVVWEKAQTFTNTSRVSTWIFAIAYRKALKSMEKEQRHIANNDVLGLQHDEVVAVTPGPDDMLHAVQSRELITRSLAQLSAEHRAVIELTYHHGFAYSEIAVIANCPEATVKTRMFHARRKLRELLAAEGWLKS